MTVTVNVDDVLALEGVAEEAVTELLNDVALAVRNAAEEGVREATVNHPYTDRTYRLSTTARASAMSRGKFEKEVDMVWPAPYAGFVDEGTSRSKAYPFTPQASAKAEETLERDVDAAVDKFVRKLGG